MKANKPVGFTAPPPKLTQRITNLQNKIAAKGGAANAPKMTAKLNRLQNKAQGKGPVAGGPNVAGTLVGNIEQQDLALQNTINGMQGRVGDAYQNPFDISGLTPEPVQGDYNQWAQQQMQAYNDAFDQRMKPIEAQQNESFEQMMADRGIPMGSQLYNQQKQQLLQSQNDARTQAYASGQSQATQNAMNLFNTGTSAHQNAIADYTTQRYAPLNEYNALRGSVSNLPSQYLDYSQMMGGKQQDQANAMAQLQFQAAHHMTGGGGGGGGGSGLGGYQGTGLSYADYLAQRNAADQANLAYQYANNPQYQKASQPSPYATMAGGILGALGGGFASGFGTSLAKGIF